MRIEDSRAMARSTLATSRGQTSWGAWGPRCVCGGGGVEELGALCEVLASELRRRRATLWGRECSTMSMPVVVVIPVDGCASGEGTASGRLRDLWTRSGAVSSSSSSSSTRSTRRRFGAGALEGEPRVIDGPCAVSDGTPPPRGGQAVAGFLPATRSSVVGAT